MIAPSELRIGNYVLIGSLVWTPIDGILSSQVFACNGVGINYIDIDPIPITPEWLERLGSDKIKLFGNDPSDTVTITIEGCVNLSFTGEVLHNIVAGIKVKYVHQLQNLYHALTGNELKIK